MKTRKPDEPVMCLQCGVPMVMTPNGHWACPTTIEAKRMLELAITNPVDRAALGIVTHGDSISGSVNPDQPPTVLTNPWNGEPRDIRDVESDPTGILMVEPGKPLRAADQPDAVLRDAERYRYMRNNASFRDRNGPGLYWYLPRFLPGGGAEQLDAAIDAELRRTADPTTEILSTTAKGG